MDAHVRRLRMILLRPQPVARRLAQVGALAIKNSAYLLPDGQDTREDFEWICREIVSEGGTAWLFRSDALVGLTDEQAKASFLKLRDADFQDLVASAHGLDDAKLTQRYEALKKIDFFGHPARAQLEAILDERKRRVGRGSPVPGGWNGRTWVTRQGIRVDRIGSAWLIRRFIDPNAQFRFVDPVGYEHAESELRFDMFEGEFTHEGQLCTFEVLVARHQLLESHPGLQPIAEMVHDIDLKEHRYDRPETSGLSRMLDGLCATSNDDWTRLERGSQIFEALLASFGEGR